MLNVGIIGLGVGEAHIPGYNSHPDCKVVALCDFDPDKIRIAKEKYPDIETTENADDILNDPNIDIVSIASYDNYHHAQIMKAIDNNKHIFVEKPLCLYEWEAKEIRNALKNKSNIKLSSNLILRKSSRFRFLKKLINDGDLGELFYIEGDYNYGRLHKITDGWRGKIDYYSVVYGGGVHIIDLIFFLTNDIVEEVSAFGTNISVKGTSFKYNDTVTSILKFRSGMVGKVCSNFACVYPHFHLLTVYGTKATFVNTFTNALLYESRDPLVSPKVIDIPYKDMQKGDLIYNFVDTILNSNIKPEVPMDDIFKTMSVCFAIEKSSIENRNIKVSYI